MNRKFVSTISNLHTNCLETKNGPPRGRQMVHPQPQTRQGESFAKPETLLLIIRSLDDLDDLEDNDDDDKDNNDDALH